MFPHRYFTIKTRKGPYEIKIKGSRFISYVFPVSDQKTAEQILEKIRKEYFNSTHVCYGYKIGEGKEKSTRYSDDGEPSGTAGLPIINEINGEELFNILIIVIRYYGGTKLGTGGLGRAYRESAKKTINNSMIIEVAVYKNREIVIPYSFMSDLMNVVEKFSIKIVNKSYTDTGIKVELGIPAIQYDKVKINLSNLSKGKIKL